MLPGAIPRSHRHARLLAASDLARGQKRVERRGSVTNGSDGRVLEAAIGPLLGEKPRERLSEVWRLGQIALGILGKRGLQHRRAPGHREEMGNHRPAHALDGGKVLFRGLDARCRQEDEARAEDLRRYGKPRAPRTLGGDHLTQGDGLGGRLDHLSLDGPLVGIDRRVAQEGEGCDLRRIHQTHQVEVQGRVGPSHALRPVLTVAERHPVGAVHHRSVAVQQAAPVGSILEKQVLRRVSRPILVPHAREPLVGDLVSNGVERVGEAGLTGNGAQVDERANRAGSRGVSGDRGHVDVALKPTRRAEGLPVVDNGQVDARDVVAHEVVERQSRRAVDDGLELEVGEDDEEVVRVAVGLVEGPGHRGAGSVVGDAPFEGVVVAAVVLDDGDGARIPGDRGGLERAQTPGPGLEQPRSRYDPFLLGPLVRGGSDERATPQEQKSCERGEDSARSIPLSAPVTRQRPPRNPAASSPAEVLSVVCPGRRCSDPRA